MGSSADKTPRPRRPRAAIASSITPAATIRDVAESAGVSTATVSRVFADARSRVSTATRRRVVRAAQELGYRPHRAARALARRRSDHIGVLLATFGGEGFVGEVMDGIAQAARATGRDTVFATFGPPGAADLRRALDHLLESRTEGIIFYPATSLPIDDKLIVAGLKEVPTVLVDIAVEGLDLPVVTSDDADGIRRAVDHLVSLGHRRIAHISGPSWMSTGAIRLRAFLEAMAAHGLPVPDEYVVPYDFTYARAISASQRLLKTTPLPTAVVTADDRCAAGLFEVAYNAGLRVPADLSVIGYSDILLCQTWHPPLTTVRQPKEELGREAVRILGNMIEGVDSADARGEYLLPTQLIVRGSCCRQSPGAGLGAEQRRAEV